MNQTKTICVFCGAGRHVAAPYFDVARETGAMLAREGFDVVYGGAHIGLMGAVADAALAHGGKVTGIIPGFLKDMEVAHTGLSELRLTETMHERQVEMAAMADGFLVLPGGMGTLAEFFEVLTWRQLGLHSKPIAVLNVFGYWDFLLEFLKKAAAENFTQPPDAAMFAVLEGAGGLKAFLDGLKK
ncbi:MAG: TIGR00730 family Rossman fold protein [Alphaproteobacteria bacterium]